MPDKTQILDAIRGAANDLGQPLSRPKFLAYSGMTEYQVLKHFPSWRAALKAAGLEPDNTNIRLNDEELLEDWGMMVRTKREIPTRLQYRRDGKFGVNTFATHFGPWSTIPEHFRRFAQGRPEWADVLALLPVERPRTVSSASPQQELSTADEMVHMHPSAQYSKLNNRPTYGNPIDFRGLRHEPVNESGVVFLFGMVAKELGYYVEAIQAGYPDCEAKRQIASGKWQRVRIEFEFESRNFRDHGHPPDGCDVIVCWHHNWDECPQQLEVVELKRIIQKLARNDD